MQSMVSEQPERFFVSEIIREQIFVQYDQEIPYACQVQIADFKERRGAKDYIQVRMEARRMCEKGVGVGVVTKGWCEWASGIRPGADS
jgi:GTP-binding protein Era